MYPKIDVIICLGSSCFARGNKELTRSIQKFIRQWNLTDKVNFKGNHCFEECHQGPNLRIGGKIYHEVNNDNLQDFLTDGLKDLLQ